MKLDLEKIKSLATGQEHPGAIKVRALTYAALRHNAQKGDILTPAEIKQVEQLEDELSEYIAGLEQKAKFPTEDSLPPMSDIQNRAFEHYYAQGVNRSLRSTAKATKQGESTIRKWSSKLKWTERIAARDRVNSQRILDEVDEGFIAARVFELKALLKIKRMFYDRLINGQVDITISDFIRVCQEEKIVRMDIGQKANIPSDNEDALKKAFLAAIEAGEAPPEPEAATA